MSGFTILLSEPSPQGFCHLLGIANNMFRDLTNLSRSEYGLQWES